MPITTIEAVTANLHNHDLTEAYSTLQAMGRNYACREAFTAGIAAGRRRDRAAVNQAISELTAWSEGAVYCASIRDTTRNLESAATLARAARIVWCSYVYPVPAGVDP